MVLRPDFCWTFFNIIAWVKRGWELLRVAGHAIVLVSYYLMLSQHNHAFYWSENIVKTPMTILFFTVKLKMPAVKIRVRQPSSSLILVWPDPKWKVLRSQICDLSVSSRVCMIKVQARICIILDHAYNSFCRSNFYFSVNLHSWIKSSSCKYTSTTLVLFLLCQMINDIPDLS